MHRLQSTTGLLASDGGRRSPAANLEEIASNYVQAVLFLDDTSSQQEEHMQYIFENLEELCAWALSISSLRWSENIVGRAPLVPSYLLCLLDTQPSHPGWQEVRAFLQEEPQFVYEGARGFIPEFFGQLVCTLRPSILMTVQVLTST